MQNSQDLDCWTSLIEKLKNILKIKGVYLQPEKVGRIFDKSIKSKFDRFFP